MSKKKSKDAGKIVTLTEESPTVDFLTELFLNSLDSVVHNGHPATMELSTDAGTIKVMITLERGKQVTQ